MGTVEDILILAKTYLSPSARYSETSCVAGINSQGQMRRLFPVPFRLIEDGKQFHKWQWIKARVDSTRNDHRLESRKVYIDTIKQGQVIPTDQEWLLRREWISRIPDSHAQGKTLYLPICQTSCHC